MLPSINVTKVACHPDGSIVVDAQSCGGGQWYYEYKLNTDGTASMVDRFKLIDISNTCGNAEVDCDDAGSCDGAGSCDDELQFYMEIGTC